MSTQFYETYTGKPVYINQFTWHMVDRYDIAHALSLQCRYNGHCKNFYSVAEHSVMVAEWIADRLKVDPDYEDWSEKDKLTLTLAALLHDAGEAYLADVPKPIKPQLTNYYEIERGIEDTIAFKYGVGKWREDGDWHHLIKYADTAILVDERDQNMNESENDWNLPYPALGVRLPFWSPQQAEKEYLHRMEHLIAAVITEGTEYVHT